VTERVIVRFEGDGSGVGELSWGQREIWSAMQDKGDSLPFCGVRALPPGQTVADVAAGLRFIMSRHQSLRTRLRLDLDGQTRQVVHASGEIMLDVVDAGDADPGETAAAVGARYKTRIFDYEHEWPLRMAVITHRDTATHVAEVISHLALDAFGLAALHDDFDRHDERTGPVTALQPLEQARRQSGPGAHRAHEASMRHFERLVAQAPDRLFRESADPRKPRFWQVTCESPAGYRAARMLANRLGLSTSPVLLAAFAVALTPLTSLASGQPVVVQLVVSNRFRPGFAGSVSPVAQSMPCMIEMPGAPFEGVALRTWQSALLAYKHAYFDPAGKQEVSKRIAAERGSEPDLGVFFNDRRVGSRELADSITGDDAVGGLPPIGDELTRTTLTWGEPFDIPEQKVFLSVVDMAGTLCCELRADTHFVSPVDMVGLLRRIESVLVNAALREGDGVEGGATAAAGPGVVR
jgi:Condensation domain